MLDDTLRLLVADAVKAQLPAIVDAISAVVRRELDARLPERWLTRVEAADALHCSIDTVDRQVVAGLLPVKRIGRRGVRVRLPVSPEASEIAQLARGARG